MKWPRYLGGVLALCAMAVVMAVVPVEAIPPIAPVHDPLLAWLQAAGFPTWAIVLLVIGRQVSTDLKDISARLERHVSQTERRLSRLETLVRGARSPAPDLEN